MYYIFIKQVYFCLPYHKFSSSLAYTKKLKMLCLTCIHLEEKFRSLNSYFVSVESLMDNLWHYINMYMITLFNHPFVGIILHSSAYLLGFYSFLTSSASLSHQSRSILIWFSLKWWRFHDFSNHWNILKFWFFLKIT